MSVTGGDFLQTPHGVGLPLAPLLLVLPANRLFASHIPPTNQSPGQRLSVVSSRKALDTPSHTILLPSAVCRLGPSQDHGLLKCGGAGGSYPFQILHGSLLLRFTPNSRLLVHPLHTRVACEAHPVFEASLHRMPTMLLGKAVHSRLYVLAVACAVHQLAPPDAGCPKGHSGAAVQESGEELLIRRVVSVHLGLQQLGCCISRQLPPPHKNCMSQSTVTVACHLLQVHLRRLLSQVLLMRLCLRQPAFEPHATQCVQPPLERRPEEGPCIAVGHSGSNSLR
mmetsp:Transcript_13500/g.33900  ORF Transcript_13500/g.33900 Transcript_13500/m.33900 type:complete len:281 (-) Transcript_13500:1810-2652(-)